MAPREPDNVNPRYLLDNGPAVVYSPSASMYYNLSRRTTEAKTAQTLTVGNPDYTNSRDTPAWRHPYYWAPFILIGPN